MLVVIQMYIYTVQYCPICVILFTLLIYFVVHFFFHLVFIFNFYSLIHVVLSHFLCSQCLDATLIKPDPANQVIKADLKTTWYVCWSRVGTKFCRAAALQELSLTLLKKAISNIPVLVGTFLLPMRETAYKSSRIKFCVSGRSSW